MSARTLISVADFDRLEEDEFRYELDERELITLTRPGARHTRIEGNLYFALRGYLEQNPIGEAFGSDILYVLGPATKRVPGVSVVLRHIDPDQEIQGAPKIAAEIISPSNTRAYIQTVEIWESATSSKTLGSQDRLETPLLPGFSHPIANLF